MPSIMVSDPLFSHGGSGVIDEATPPESPGGRLKAPPVCVDRTLKSFALSTEALTKLVFPPSVTNNIVTATTMNKPSEAHPSVTNAGVGLGGVITQGLGATSTNCDLAIPISSSSSTCTRESDTLSDAEGGHHHSFQHHHIHPHHATPSNGSNGIKAGVVHALGAAAPTVKASGPSPVIPSEDAMLAHPLTVDTFVEASTASCPVTDPKSLNAKVSLQKTSRQGRSTQRWQVDPNTHETIRLVTGCVPILTSGKILFVSSSRQSEWILPKGGWEQDEAIEESAIRECFEEAGVLGTLGPPLQDVQYETRKAKKRRLEQEELLCKKVKEEVSESAAMSEADATLTRTPAAARSQAFGSPETSPPTALTAPPPTSAATEASTATTPVHANLTPMPSPISKEDLYRIRWLAQQNAPKPSDETLSVASNVSGTHSQVRMTLFPLYVTEVHEDWPESGRLRTAVDIDQAIRIMESRPEFKVALQEVKDRGLHLLAHLNP